MLLLLSLTAIPVTAAVSGRINNIKSHGVFVGTNGTEEVVLDSADLRYLASQLDALENIVNGLNRNTDADIVYAYHHHVGNSSVCGGCYTKDVKKPIYATCRTMQSGCTNGHNSSQTDAAGNYLQECQYTITHYDCGASTQYGTYPLHHGYEHRGGSSSTHSYVTGYTHDYWGVNCGYREGEIESATIVFAPSS